MVYIKSEMHKSKDTEPKGRKRKSRDEDESDGDDDDEDDDEGGDEDISDQGWLIDWFAAVIWQSSINQYFGDEYTYLLCGMLMFKSFWRSYCPWIYKSA